MRASEGSPVQYTALDIFSFHQKKRKRARGRKGKKTDHIFLLETLFGAKDVIQSAKWEENSGGLQVWPASQESVRSSEMTPLHREQH